jgi:hypothetical protein
MCLQKIISKNNWFFINLFFDIQPLSPTINKGKRNGQTHWGKIYDNKKAYTCTRGPLNKITLLNFCMNWYGAFQEAGLTMARPWKVAGREAELLTKFN